MVNKITLVYVRRISLKVLTLARMHPGSVASGRWSPSNEVQASVPEEKLASVEITGWVPIVIKSP